VVPRISRADGVSGRRVIETESRIPSSKNVEKEKLEMTISRK
jgi:hypothetical protein